MIRNGVLELKKLQFSMNLKVRGSVTPVGILVSKTVPSSKEPVYQQLTVSPFFGKLALSPFFSTDLVYLGGPCEKEMRERFVILVHV